MNKKRVLENAKVKDNIQKLINEFEGEEAVMRFVYESNKRSAYAKNIDRDFYKEVMKVLKKMSDYIVLLNANKMFHLWAYRSSIMSHETTIKKLCDQVIKRLDNAENED